MKEDEKRKLIQKAREDDHFNLQLDKNDFEMLHIYVKYQLFKDQVRTI
jgi:hypothetical protein